MCPSSSTERRLPSWATDPETAQKKTLRSLLAAAESTSWGRAFNYRELSRTDDVIASYQHHVPLTGYDRLSPYIERMRGGEPNVLCPGLVKHYAVSSGTSSAGKVLPASRRMLRTMARCSVDVGFQYARTTAGISFLLARLLTLPGRLEPASTQHARTVIGEMSALVSLHAPLFIRRINQAVPNAHLVHCSWEDKLRLIAARTLSMDIRALAAQPTWVLMLFEVLAEKCREQHGWYPSSIAEIWPNLRVIFSGGVALSSYRELLEEKTRDTHFIETYSASEGFFAFQTDPRDTDMLLHLRSGVFYEFVPVVDLNKPEPKRYTVGSVEPGTPYALYVTTCSGLWSYPVRDIVRFTSLNPHRIIVAGRTTEMMDRYGEAFFEDEARAALRYACRETEANIVHFHVSPLLAKSGKTPNHQWFIEFSRKPEASIFSRLLDEEICRINQHYQILREGGALGAPEVVLMPRGSFYDWLRRTRESIGGQTKIPRMRDDRQIADQLLEIADHD